MNCDECAALQHRAVDGELSPPQAEGLAEHIRQCESCRGALRSVHRLRGLLGQWGAEQAFERARARARPAIAEAAAIEAACEPGDRSSQGCPEVLTIGEAATFLRVDEASVHRALPQLPHFTVGGHIRFRRASLERWIEQEEGRTSPAGLVGPALALVPEEGAPWALVG